MSKVITFLLCSSVFSNLFAGCHLSGLDDPDYDRDTCMLIESRGFHCETHYPVTNDGYILSLFRIVNPFTRKSRGSVLLLHGLLGSSDDYLIASPGGNARPQAGSHKIGGNLGFEISNHGYDVWLGNFRGNWYSTNHTKLSPVLDKRKFWDFNIDHLVEHDLPAFTGHITKTTGENSIGYIGHSVGAAAMLALLASQPAKYSHVFKPVILLSPESRMTNTPSLTFSSLARIPSSDALLSDIGGPFPPPIPMQNFLVNVLCQNMIRSVCRSVLSEVVSLDTSNHNQTRFPVMMSRWPQTSSAATVAHIVQSVKGNKFRKFDYSDEDENYRIHNKKSPPRYRLEHIQSHSLALFYSKDDDAVGIKDVKWLIKQLRVPLLDDYLIPQEDFKHFDYIWSKKAPKLVFGRILQLLDSSMPSRQGHAVKKWTKVELNDRFWYKLDSETGTNAERVNFAKS
ncbi:Lipase 1 [Halotydeus destructor]|nr:Lipase 1 [Halotydeus destructor]